MRHFQPIQKDHGSVRATSLHEHSGQSFRHRVIAPLRTAWLALAAALLAALFSAPLVPTVFASGNPVPYIDLVSPVSVNPGATGVTITVLGTGFVSGSVVNWNSVALTTTFVSSKKLTATVPDSFVAAVGLGSITVFNPSVGDGNSNVFYLPVASNEASIAFPSSPSSSVSTGSTPQGLVTADLNGDGKLDLAIANQGDNTVTVLLGNGDGTFTLKSTPAAGSGANWIAVGDFNEDGKPDLAVANLNSSGPAGVSILLGNGDGTYTAGASLTTGVGPFGIATADFNHDGHLDLAVSNSNAGTVSVFLGNGNGTFGSGSTFTVGNNPQVIVPGDFNEDGILDLAVANLSDGSVSVLLGVGNGSFGAQSVFSTGGSGQPIGLIAADFNKDNHLDLAAVNASDVAILLGNGAGSFTLHANPGTGTGDLIAGVAGDYNGDGNLDIVLSDRSAGEAFLLPGLGSGDFGGSTTFTTASGAFGVATADFNGDGGLDLAVANGNANNVSIFLQILPVSLSPTSLAFGNQAVNTASSPAKTVTLKNSSGSTLHISSIAFTGANNGDFSKGGTCSTSTPVSNGGTCTITVTFTPGAVGARVATLTVTDDAGNSPQTLALTGTGVVLPPTISKAFGAASIPLNGTTSLTFTITNPGGNATSLTGIAFTDSMPSGLVVATPNGLTGTCGGGTITATAGSSSVSLTGATLAASGSCNFSVNVTGTGASIEVNMTGAVSSNESGPGSPSNVANLTVISPPILAKAFGAATIPLNGSTSLTFTITNANGVATLSGIAFADTLPAGLVVATPNGLTVSCGGGTITATAGSSTISLSGATIASSSSCNFAVNITGTTAGTKFNSTSSVTSTEGGTGGTASASLAVEAPPSIAKVFTPNAIALNATTSLTFTITNPGANAVSLTGVAFTDTLPTGLTVGNASATICGGTVTTTAPTGISLTGATIAASSQCQFSVTVTGAASGQYTNTTGAVTSTNGGTGNTATANLSVATPPTITKSFGAAAIPLNGSTSLTFAIANPVANSFSLTGVAFADSLPAGLVVATPNGLSGTCGGGTITAVAGSSSVSLSGATLASSGSCSFSVNVAGATAGVKNNSVTVTSTTAGTGNTSNASVTVVGPPVIIKAFGAAGVPLNGSTSLTFTIQNNNTTQSLSGIAFSDTFPAGLAISTPNGLTGSCGGGTITGTQGTSLVSLAGATIAASSSCTFAVNVTGASAGPKNNTTGNVTSTEGGTGGTASSSLNVVAPPSIAKVFTPNAIAPSATTSLTFTITNPGANAVASTGVAFTDTLPTGLTVANASATICGGTLTTTAPIGISLTGATIAASGQCQFSVTVTGAAPGQYTNTTGAVTSTNGGTGNTATANLSVGSSPSFTSANNVTFTVGVTSFFTITTTGSPTPSIQESLILPFGMAYMDNGNGTATFSGNPLPGTAGVYPLTLTAHNGVGTDAVQSFTLTIAKQTPTVTWNTPANITFGAALSGTQLNASSGTPGTFVYSPVAGTVLGAGSQNLSVTFTPTSTAVFATVTANVTLTVDKATPAITWAAPATVNFGTALGATQLNASTSAAGTFVYTPAAGAILNAGTQTLSVTFTPTDLADELGSTTQVSLVVNPAATAMTVSSSSASSNLNATATFTVTVTSSGGSPSGSVTFFDGTTALGTVTLSGGTASFSTAALTAGAHTISASYSGSPNFAASTAAGITETIVPPGITLAGPTTTSSVQSGQAMGIPITVTPVGGITGQVQFSVTGVPTGATISFSPPTITLGASAAVETLMVTTQPAFDYLAQHGEPARRAMFAGIFCFPIAGLLFAAAPARRRKIGTWLFLLVLCSCVGVASGCASRGFQNAGTVPGTYPLTVTATVTAVSGTMTQTTVVNLVVR